MQIVRMRTGNQLRDSCRASRKHKDRSIPAAGLLIKLLIKLPLREIHLLQTLSRNHLFNTRILLLQNRRLCQMIHSVIRFNHNESLRLRCLYNTGKLTHTVRRHCKHRYHPDLKHRKAHHGKSDAVHVLNHDPFSLHEPLMQHPGSHLI